jgi:threonine dehydratase
MTESVRKGEAITLDTVRTFADGIAVKYPGDTTFEIVQKYVDEVVTVSEDEIAAAILTLIEKQKLIAEGAGAVSVAAALFNKLPLAGKKVVCLVSCGNIDVNILSRVITRGLITAGRNATLTIALEDKPGQLVGVSNIVASLGGNVTAVHHEHTNPGSAVNGCYLSLELETRNFEHIEQIRTALTDAGFKIL